MVKTVERAELSSESAELLSATCKTFTEQFSEEGTHAAFAPGRVNLIGEHTDYNDGFVFPMVSQIYQICMTSRWLLWCSCLRLPVSAVCTGISLS